MKGTFLYFYVKKSGEIFFGHLSGVVNILCQKVVKTGQVVQELDLGAFWVLGGVLMVKKLDPKKVSVKK